MEIVPYDGPLGAEIRDIDLREPLDEATLATLRRALLDHLLLVARRQELADEDQVRFSRYWGEPRPHVREQPDRPVDEIFVVSNVLVDGKPIGALGYGELTFHSDLSYMERPGSVSVVYAVEVPRTGGDTEWANCYLAYEALPEDLRRRLATLRAMHRHGEEKQNPPVPVSHPVIRTHPDTGRRALFVSPQFTRSIVGVPEHESRELLDTLFAHLSRREFIWKHRWRPGDLVFWDNRCTLHRREPFDEKERRILKRTQMFGEVPFL
jgi:taurine dioxygenase